MKIQHLGTLASLATAALLAGCATGGGESRPESFPQPYAEKEIKIFVTNLAFSDATLYGITNGGRVRLGQITGKKDQVFTLPLEFSSELQLEIDLLAGPRCFTERMMVDPGDHLDLLIENEYRLLNCVGS
jgi:hypothetical protein